MSAGTLAVVAVVDALIAGLLVWTGLRFAVGRAHGDARLAVRAFQAWWFGLAFGVAVSALREGIAAVGLAEESASLFNVLQYAYFAATCIAVWGLLAYLAYLYTGRASWIRALGAFYAVYAVVAVVLVARMRPAGVTPGKWFVQWAYEAPEQGALVAVMALLLLLPQIGAAVAYLSIRKRVADPVARHRIAVVGWSLVLWLGIVLAAPFLQLGRFEWWQAGGRLVGLAAALVIVRAYPRVAAMSAPDPHLDDVASHAASGQRAEVDRREQLVRRAQDLI